MTDQPTSRRPDLPLPAWHWNPDTVTLRATCPVCGERLMVSGTRLTCVLMGHAHYHQPVHQVIDEVLAVLQAGR